MTQTPSLTTESEAAYGLFPAADFRITTGECADCSTIPQALWFFRKESVAVPLPGLPLAGFDAHLRAAEDLRSWNKQHPPGTVNNYPSLVWLGATQVLSKVRLNATATQVQSLENVSEFALAPRLESNRSYFNAESAAFF
jgi:hypothetical protein